jgi:hypothetical protein
MISPTLSGSQAGDVAVKDGFAKSLQHPIRRRCVHCIGEIKEVTKWLRERCAVTARTASSSLQLSQTSRRPLRRDLQSETEK